jgi:hypothetical protein
MGRSHRPITSGVRAGRLIARVGKAVAERLSPERTRRATLLERVTADRGDRRATLPFVAARSAIGFARWRLQRELWRRDVERMTESLELQGRTHPKNGVTHGG